MLSEIKLKALLSAMTLEEKIGMVHGNGFFETKGVKRLNIPPLLMSDGPMGVRKEFPNDSWLAKDLSNDYVTYFLSNTALAATWNEDHAYAFGQALGSEARSRGKDVILAPGINIIRSPLCGRNFEYMSEDPHLISKMAVPIIKGIQENDVAACVKHYAVNNQETRRLEVNVEVDDRSLEELYLPAFKACVTEQKSLTLMAAYNQLRGDYCCESTYLLKDILRDRWGYDGVVISDWGATHSTDKAALAGLDIEMSVTTDFDDYYFGQHLYNRVEAGHLPIKLIDEKITRILNLMNQLNMLDGPRQRGSRNTTDHQNRTLKAGEESIVLLTNEDGFLPLNQETIKSILVVGENGERTHANGGGSAEIKALYEHSPLAGLSMYLGGTTKLTYAKGYTSDPSATSDTYFNLREEACRLALSHDLVLFVGGLNHDFDTEGKDRGNIHLPYEQDLLIKALAKVHDQIVAVNVSGSAVDLSTVAANAKSLIQTWYNGMEGGRALAHVLFGEVSPSGKLPFTFANSLEDYASHSVGEFPGDEIVNYKESIFVGYRHFDTHNVKPQFSFGHGLSYSEFQYTDLTVDQSGTEATVKVSLKNIGSCEAKEVVQLYVGDEHASQPRPSKELKGFRKICLTPGEAQELTFTLSQEDFSYYNETSKQWVMESGTFNILIGSSSTDIRLQKSLTL